MPNLNNLGVPRYESGHPYHYTFDNAPLEVLEQRDVLINDQVDAQGLILQDSAGNMGTLTNRLFQFVDEDGNLKTTAMDDAEHSIAAHTDGDGFVRMTDAERAKLTTIDSNANEVTFTFEGLDETDTEVSVTVDSGEITFASSSDVQLRIASGPIISAEILNYPRAHIHFYEIVPTIDTLDDRRYNINFGDLLEESDPLDGTLQNKFKPESVAVYVNGIRLNQTTAIFHPSVNSVTLTPTDDDYSIPAETVIVKDWILNKFTVLETEDEFEQPAFAVVLDQALNTGDVIFLDFECDI